MKAQPEKTARSGHKTSPSVILDKWSSAIASLYTNYTQLNSWVNAHQPTGYSKQLVTNLGQCSLSDAIVLLNNIQTELTKLLADMDDPAYPNTLSIKEHYQTLMDHTLKLENLNRRAQKLLQLASIPPC